MQSGAITHNRETWLRTSVTGPGTLTFWWKVYSEANYDLLEFTLDDAGSPTASISGNKDWRQVGVAIYGSGTHSLEWKYVKDYTRSLGEDTGWVDKVVWQPESLPSPTPSGTPVPTPSPSPTPTQSPPPPTPPPPPCRFYGTVQVDSAGVPDGTVITGIVEGDEHTTTTPAVYGPSTYALIVTPPEGTSYEDAAVIFMIDDLVAEQTGIWVTGGNIMLNLSAVTEQQEWSVPMTTATATEGSNPNLGFGTNEAATDGFDSGIDIPHPQPPTVFDAYFSISNGLFPQLDKDYRAPGDTVEWALHVGSNPEEIGLTWDASAVPQDVPLWMTGTGVQVDMKDVSNTVLAAGAHDLTISTELPAPCGTVPLDEGLNLISLPLIPDDTNIETVLAGVSSNVATVWHYDAGTKAWSSWAPFWGGDLLTMQDGRGYWLQMNAADTLIVEGVEFPLPPALPPTYPVFEGWNLIGFKSCTPRTASDYLAAIVGKWTVMYDGQGQRVLLGDYMEPGCGYWLAANNPGTIYP